MKRCFWVLALVAAHSALPMQSAPGNYQAWRAQAAGILGTRRDANSLATAAAQSFADPAPKPQGANAPGAVSPLDLAARASDLAPQSAGINWLHLQLCAQTPACDVRDLATVLRWVDADNRAAWMPTLAAAQKDKHTTEVDRALTGMAQGSRFDLYWNRIVVLMFDALRNSRSALPAGYAASDWARFIEVSGIASTEVIPPFAPLIDACREPAPPLRRDACLKLAKTMQRGDTVAAQMIGFGIEKRLLAPDSKEQKSVAQAKHLLEWRVMAAAEFDLPLMPWTKNARARDRIAQ